MTFADLRLNEPILRALVTEGYTVPTPIQVEAIPHVLAGRDMLGSAQTGTGKTAAFALPILQRLAHPRTDGVRALILVPTRELATQIGESFYNYGRHTGLRNTVLFGGVGQGPQERALRAGPDIVIATPGRLLDLMTQRIARLGKVEILVLDEADRMLDMGFIHDMRRVIAQLPEKKQTLLFSATMPREIRSLAESLLRNPVTVQVAAISAPVEKVEQLVYHVNRGDKPALLRHLLAEVATGRTLIFTRTKRGADRVVSQLRAGGIRADAIHGNKNQNARQRALLSFKSQQPPVLVATDIASRGIDVDDIAHVFNYEIPGEPETYVHRIGRTARAGAGGTAISFCDAEERPHLRAIERLIRQSLDVRTAPAHMAKVRVTEPTAGSSEHAQRPAHQAHHDKPVRHPHHEQPHRDQPHRDQSAHQAHRDKPSHQVQSEKPLRLAHHDKPARSAHGNAPRPHPLAGHSNRARPHSKPGSSRPGRSFASKRNRTPARRGR